MHPKLTPERLEKMVVLVCALPDGRAHVSQFPWLMQFPAKNVKFVPFIKDMITCTRNQWLNYCAKLAHKPFEEFVFIDGDVMPNNKTYGFWDSDADVVCCKADMPTNHGAWDSPEAWHDPLWRCKADVLTQLPLPYYEYKFNNLGTQEIHCICQGFAKKCRKAGFSVGVSGECGHQMTQTWTSTGCLEKSFAMSKYSEIEGAIRVQ